MLSLLVIVNLLLVVRVWICIFDELIKLLLVYVLRLLGDSFELVAFLLDPLLLHGLSKTNLGNLRADTTFHGWHVDHFAYVDVGDELVLRRAV